ncbi:unnamed protein product [Echinostoma caproni]|uniref:Tick transposon n=1 Tax=Echinostoma caproni TaxID=27848 RepID=A0A183AHD1_9TREM|nr:unnamed protein product [Echinostoma caproni]
MDSVTVLATQLLQDDLVPITSQQRNSHNVLGALQACNLSQLLPKLRKMVILTGDGDLINLAQQAQNAARKILQSYGSFFDSALLMNGNSGTVLNLADTPVENNQRQCAGDRSVRKCVNRGTQSFVDTPSVVPDKKDAFTMTQDVIPPLAGESRTAYLMQLRKQLTSEQEQARNLSSQLLHCQRGAEKMRLNWIQREAELQAELRACQDRESELIKSNTELRNELRLADYQISQLQFRLSLLERVPSSRAAFGVAHQLLESDRTVPLDMNRATLTRSSNLCEPSCCENGLSVIHRSAGEKRKPAASSKRTDSANAPYENIQVPPVKLRDSTLRHSTDVSATSSPERVLTPQPNDEKQPEPQDSMDEQSIASTVSHSSEDASSLHTADELEFRKGLAQLDERINTMRRALLPRDRIRVV